MMLRNKWRENAERVRQAGLIALEQAKAAGVPAYYMDPALGEGIVKEMPDGRRLLLKITDGEEHVVADFGPRG